MQSTVLILGARGRFGLAAAKAFADAGWRVIAQMRTAAAAPAAVAFDPRIQWLAQDWRATDELVRAAAGASVVVHAINPAYTNAAWRAEALPMLDAGIAVSRALGATLMLPGNVYNFGADMPMVLREDTPQRANTIKGRIRMGLEAQLQRSGVRSVVIRAGDFFGSGTGTWFDQALVKDLRKGTLTYPGALDVATPWAYLPDLARTFVVVAQRRGTLNPFEVLHFSGSTITGRQWVEALTPLAREQGWLRGNAGLAVKRLPWTVIRLGGLFVATWAALAEMAYLWQRPHVLDNGKLRTLIGTEPHMPLDVAVRQALVDLGLVQAAAKFPLVPHSTMTA